MRSASVMMTLLCATLGCTKAPTRPAETAFEPSSPEAFAGEWRSVTPSREFISLSVVSKSSEMGAVGARLTFSGVFWEGGGRIEGDSLVTSMTIVGASTAGGVLVARARDAQTLRVQFRSGTAPQLELTFAREQ
jgi:hypothetical protein